MTCPDQERAHEIARVHEATIEALAKAIDAYDEPADDHVRRVRLHAEALAPHVGFSTIEVEAVKSAAVLHDIGKLGVPAHILAKPGPLTAEEFDRVRVHPRLGAEIIEAVPFSYPDAPLILCPTTSGGTVADTHPACGAMGSPSERASSPSSTSSTR